MRMPVVYLPHGGGPWPFVELGFGTREEASALLTYLRTLPSIAAARPRALLVISAHWEEPRPTVTTSTAPPLLFDYYGFPDAAYRLTWPAPGDPQLAQQVRSLLRDAGFESAEDPSRGFDHGTFVPLKVAFPDASIPTVQLSLVQGLEPRSHLAIGRALSALRDEGVLIVGSGMSYHNMRGFGGRGRTASFAFDGWLATAMQAPQAARDASLESWAAAPSAREAHPREEHLLPLMVVAGAAQGDVGRAVFQGTFADVALSAFQFG